MAKKSAQKECSKCGKKSQAHYHDKFCRTCFQEVIEKRVRKYVRINKLFNKGDNILVIGDLTEYFLKSILKDLPVTITKKNFASPFGKQVREFVDQNKVTKVVVPWTLDNEVDYFLGNWLEKKTDYALLGELPLYVKLFKPVMEKELEKFARTKKISFKAAKKNKLLESIEKKYPGSKFGMARSIEELKGVLR